MPVLNWNDWELTCAVAFVVCNTKYPDLKIPLAGFIGWKAITNLVGMVSIIRSTFQNKALLRESAL